MSEATRTTDRPVEADVVRALYAQTPRLCVPPIVAAAICVAVLWGPSSPPQLLIWFALMVANSGIRFALYRLFLAKAGDLARTAFWARWFTVPVLINGLLFGSMAVFFYPADDPIRQIFILISLATATNAGFAMAYYPPAMLVHMLALLVPTVWRFGIQAGDSHVIATLGIAFYGLLVVVFGLTQTRVLRETIVTRRRNLELIEALRQKSELAEAAQKKAEQASLAKSQFFAAASHDLRQPMQALGLFAASLRETKHEPEDARRIDQILSSVDALESLFDELLDISKLDAGNVKPVLTHSSARSLFERLANIYAPLAHKSGIALRFADAGSVLHTDAVLLERVLGNLLSNALRYTRAGSVDVRCWPENGQVRVEVADTGPGIPAEEHERVFDEFYQIGNPERDRRKGLGLGLATVKRIALLLGCRVSLESETGKGSVFSLSVPAGDPARVVVPAAATSVEDLDPLQGKVIAVVDDERDVRDGLADLLGMWRCTPVVAASARDLLVQLEASGLKPDAVIADYRLREHQTGIVTIEELRTRYGAALPALIMSGDTTPEIFKFVRECRLPLLSKPVRAARLRAALQHLLSDAREAAHAVA